MLPAPNLARKMREKIKKIKNLKTTHPPVRARFSQLQLMPPAIFFYIFFTFLFIYRVGHRRAAEAPRGVIDTYASRPRTHSAGL